MDSLVDDKMTEKVKAEKWIKQIELSRNVRFVKMGLFTFLVLLRRPNFE